MKNLFFPAVLVVLLTSSFNPTGKFYLSENGVTCKCPNTVPGEKGTINGVEFESVDNALLRKRRDEGKDLTKVCTSLVSDMSGLFKGDYPYNVDSVIYINPFNQPIGNWDVSQVTDMSNMFFSSAFNQPIANWDVSKVTNMSGMFCYSQFNQPIRNWDVSKVTDMSNLFKGGWMWMDNVNPFNHPLENWDVGNVKDMTEMFSSSQFNQSIGNWDVSKVTDMSWMFFSSDFNQPIGNWDVRNVTNMRGMLDYSIFDQDLSKWCVTQFDSQPEDFLSSVSSELRPKNMPKWGTCPD
jgi:surface protein